MKLLAYSSWWCVCVKVQGDILRITQATMEDRGIYICHVSNVAGRAMASGIVDIERKLCLWNNVIQI